jgi:2-oxoglutarate dehydrogenase E2 component (dihydrolipoamide succinyltransferase)
MTSTEFLLAPLPFGSAEITIVRWLKRAGDSVAAGEPLLVVVNDRVEAALPVACAGFLERPLAAEGAVVAVGAPVAIIIPAPAAPDGALADVTPSRLRISPVARNIARLHEIDITKLQASGVAGRMMKSDVLTALVARPSAIPITSRHSEFKVQNSELKTPLPSPISNLPVSASPRHPITLSPVTRHPSPLTILTAVEVDLERVAALIDQHGPSFARRRQELNYVVCVALAAVAALPYHPLLNSYWADTMIVARRRVHLAVAQRAGAPPCFVPDAQDLNLRGFARALSGSADEPTSADCTFVIADLGEQPWGDPATLMYGSAAALGMGTVRARPLVIDDGGVDRLAVRHAAWLTLAYDPRVLDQPYADAFLRDVKSRLERCHF